MCSILVFGTKQAPLFSPPHRRVSKCHIKVAMGLAEEEDCRPLLARFDELDKDGSGRLDKDDLLLFASAAAAKRKKLSVSA